MWTIEAFIEVVLTPLQVNLQLQLSPFLYNNKIKKIVIYKQKNIKELERLKT